jgi:tetratricopeptide (TPR) repeat protein
MTAADAPEPSAPSQAAARRVGRRRKRPRLPRERAGLALFALALSVPALMLGGQHTPVLLLAAVLAAGSALLFAHRVERLPQVGVLALALFAYTAFQLVPLPAGVVGWLSPAGAEVWSGAFKPFGEAGPRFVPLTVEPAATALELLKAAIYACLVLAACGVVSTYGTAAVALVLFGAALLVALVTLAHGIVGADRVYGLYPAPIAERWARGPFVNGNNLSGFLNIGLFAGAGLWLADGGRLPRWLPALGIPVLAMSVVLAASRGGVGALVIGVLAFVALAHGQRDRRRPPVLGGAALLACVGVVALLAAGGERVRTQLGDADLLTKFNLWRWTAGLIAEFPAFGVGRGAFETAFQPYRGASEHERSVIFAHAENFVLDWAAEWGVPVALGALLAAAWIGRVVLRRARREPLLLGLAVGLGVLLLQNLVDFGLELFALGAAAVTAFVTLTDSERDWAVRKRVWLLAPVVCAALAAVVVIALAADPVQVERRELAKSVAAIGGARGEALAAAKAELRRAMLRHPGEAYFPLLGAYLARREGGDPLPWLGRALARAPRSGNVHLALAEVMRARGKNAQALMHLRLAARHDYTLREGALLRAASWASSWSELERAFPEGSEGGKLAKKLCALLSEPDRLACLRTAVRREPEDLDSVVKLAERLLDTLEARVAPCAPAAAEPCLAEAERVIGLMAASGHDWRAAYARARAQALRGNPRGAAERLLEDCPVSEEAEPCIARALKLAETAGDLPVLERAGQRYLALACASPQRCAEAHGRVAEALSGRGAWPAAVRHYSDAAQVDPSPRRWLDVAQAATRSGALMTARMALRKADGAGELTADERRLKADLEAKLNDPDAL